MAVSNSTHGFEVKITCEKDVITHQQDIVGSFLSPLNSNDIWVENLTQVDQNNTTHVNYKLLLPLVYNVGVLDVLYDSDTGEWVTSFLPLRGINEPCRTLFTQRIINVLYTACIYPSQNSKFMLKLYQIDLVSQEPTVRNENYLMVVEGFWITNIVYADKGSRSGDKRFYVVVDGIVWTIIPTQLQRGGSSTRLEFAECVNFTCTSVDYILPPSLLIHCLCCSIDQNCTPYGIYYDIYDMDDPVTNEPSNEGLPYYCPDYETTIIIHSETHHYTVNGAEYSLQGDGFRDGLCSGNTSSIWFAYQDDTGCIFVTDLSDSSNFTPVFHMVSEKGCLQGPNCNPISNVSDILMIQEFDETSDQVITRGIKPNTNYSVLFEIYSPHPNFFALVDIPSSRIPPMSSMSSTQTQSALITPSSSPSSSPSVVPSQEGRGMLIVIVACIVAAVCVVVAFLGVGLLWCYRKHPCSR